MRLKLRDHQRAVILDGAQVVYAAIIPQPRLYTEQDAMGIYMPVYNPDLSPPLYIIGGATTQLATLHCPYDNQYYRMGNPRVFKFRTGRGRVVRVAELDAEALAVFQRFGYPECWNDWFLWQIPLINGEVNHG